MTTRKLFTIGSMVFALSQLALGQLCPPNRKPWLSPLPPCKTVLERIGESVQGIRRNTADLNKSIDAARRRYWQEYPSGPNLAAAEADFDAALLEKDYSYFFTALPEGFTGRMVTIFTAINGGDKAVDGGIRPTAYPLFVAWVRAVRRQLGARNEGDLAIVTGPRLNAALEAAKNRQITYMQERNWAEIDASGIDDRKYINPKMYALRLIARRLSESPSDFASAPDSVSAALTLYDLFSQAMGENNVLDAAKAVLALPKDRQGELTAPIDVEVGGDLREFTTSPYLVFVSRFTSVSPHNYAIALLSNNLADYSVRWQNAVTSYDQLTTKYGERTVLAAAARIKATPKTVSGTIASKDRGGYGNAASYWFTEILTNPAAVLPDGRIPRVDVTKVDPTLLGRRVVLFGTVARVELTKIRSQEKMTIHFANTNNDNVTVYSNDPGSFYFEFGKDLSGLVGKRVDVEGFGGVDDNGRVIMHVTERKQVKVLDTPR